MECVVGLSQQDFSSVISGLASLLQELIKVRNKKFNAEALGLVHSAMLVSSGYLFLLIPIGGKPWIMVQHIIHVYVMWFIYSIRSTP